LARWLYAVAALVVLMVVVGGITRLTESGLSITEWKPISGAIPPLTQADWQHQFDLYRQTTQYQQMNRGMTLPEFQFIFFWEWVHRLIGRLIGVAFALPLAWFAWKRAIPAGYGPRLLALLALGGLQGVVGWWMVVSGLAGRTEVSHYRLAVHLCLALLILGALVWTARDLSALVRDPASRPAKLRLWPALALGVLAVQLVWGAFTAGLRAGYAFSSWPLMGDELFPAATPMLSPPWLNLFDNPIVVQFVHRWWAFAAAGAMIWLGIKAIRAGQRRAGIALHVLVTAQVCLGIATLLSGVELWVAVAHQGVAALVVAAAALSAHALGMRRMGKPA
jgi:cytochrome c oxidase assembly protein subunit 15